MEVENGQSGEESQREDNSVNDKANFEGIENQNLSDLGNKKEDSVDTDEKDITTEIVIEPLNEEKSSEKVENNTEKKTKITDKDHEHDSGTDVGPDEQSENLDLEPLDIDLHIEENNQGRTETGDTVDIVDVKCVQNHCHNEKVDEQDLTNNQEITEKEISEQKQDKSVDLDQAMGNNVEGEVKRDDNSDNEPKMDKECFSTCVDNNNVEISGSSDHTEEVKNGEVDGKFNSVECNLGELEKVHEKDDTHMDKNDDHSGDECDQNMARDTQEDGDANVCGFNISESDVDQDKDVVCDTKEISEEDGRNTKESEVEVDREKVVQFIETVLNDIQEMIKADPSLIENSQESQSSRDQDKQVTDEAEDVVSVDSAHVSESLESKTGENDSNGICDTSANDNKDQYTSEDTTETNHSASGNNVVQIGTDVDHGHDSATAAGGEETTGVADKTCRQKVLVPNKV